MAEFLLKPNDFQKQIDSFKSKTEVVKGLEYTFETHNVLLQCIEKYVECVQAMNGLLTEFAEFAELDANTMQQIKATWMHADGDIATKTIGEI